MNRLFDGEVLPLMKHLINDRGIADDDLVELRRLLDTAANDRDEDTVDE